MDSAVEAALTENHSEFLRYLARRLGSGDIAEDVLQEFYLRATNKAYALQNTESVVAWLYRVLKSTMVDYLRKETTRRNREAEFARDQALVVDEVDEDLNFQICTCFYRLLPTLKAEYAEIVWRADLLGHTRREIATNLGISENNVMVRLHRARQALKRALLLSCETCPEHGFFDCACEGRPRHVAVSS